MASSSRERLQKAAIDPRCQRFANFRQEHKSFVNLAYGHAGKPKILNYDLDTLIGTGALHTAAKTAGTIFTMDPVLAKSQLMYMAIFGAAFCLRHFAFPDGVRINQHELENLAEYLNVFIPFILGLYISSGLSRWWSLRVDGLGAVLDAAQNTALLMSGMFPGPEWVELHDQVLKWALASVTLIVHSCRGSGNIDGLGPSGDNLITAEEKEILETAPYRARPVLIWTWILLLNAKACHEHNLPEGKYRDIAAECLFARNGISTIWTFLRTQLPFAYVHLVTFLVNVNNLVVAVKCGILSSMAIKEEIWSQLVNQVLFLFVVPPLYQGLLGISHVIHDPFGEDLLDFPVMAFQENLNESAFSLTSSGWKCPALKMNWNPVSNHAEKKAEPATPTTAGDGICGLERKQAATLEVNEAAGISSEIRDTVLCIKRSIEQQAQSKQDLIAVMQTDVQRLQSDAAEVNKTIQRLENNLMLNMANSTLDEPPSIWDSWMPSGCQSPLLAKAQSLPQAPTR
jgi:hypothetical protein